MMNSLIHSKIFCLSSLFFVLIFSSFSSFALAESFSIKNETVEYEIEGGTVQDIYLDPDFLELVVGIESTDDGILQISIPRAILDAKFEGMDDIFFVIVEGFETEYVEITGGQNSRTILIPFFFGDTKIEIIGTEVLEGDIEEIISDPEIEGLLEPEEPTQPEPEPTEEIEIPNWVKSNAGWWADGLIGDSDFVSGIQFLIQEGIMTIPPTESGDSSAQEIPVWIRNNAGWWASDQINDSDFVSGIQFLITNGIMKI